MRLSRFTDIAFNVLLPLLLGVVCYACAHSFPLPVLLRNWGADALWAFAFMSLLLIVWERRIPRLWIAAPFVLALSYEGGQWSGFLPGTADLWDLLAYSLFFCIALFLNPFFIIPKQAIKKS
jgi:hypothetical protein